MKNWLFSFGIAIALLFGLFNIRAAASDDQIRIENRIETLKTLHDTVEYLKTLPVYDLPGEMDRLQAEWHVEVSQHSLQLGK